MALVLETAGGDQTLDLGSLGEGDFLLLTVGVLDGLGLDLAADDVATNLYSTEKKREKS